MAPRAASLKSRNSTHLDKCPDLVKLDQAKLPPISTGILELAYALASQDPEFHVPRGAGAGDHHTNNFMKKLNVSVARKWPVDVKIEHPVSEIAKWNVDFYIPGEATIVEIALSSRNPNTELEKDIFKALVGRESGIPVSRLVLLGKSAIKGKTGTLTRLNNPAAIVTREFVRRHHDLAVIVREFSKEFLHS